MQDKLMVWDIESYLYKACSACKEMREIEPFVFQEVYNLKKGIDYINEQYKLLRRKTQTSKCRVVLGDAVNFRKSISATYKSNRKSKPIMYDMLLDYVVNNYDCAWLPTLEADDVVSILATDKELKEDMVVVSIDKDLKTIPDVFIYRPITDNATIEYIDKETAERNLKIQVLAGDSADGYKGVPNIGQVNAKKLVLDIGVSWDEIKGLFINAGLKEEDFLTTKRLASLVTFDEYDFDKGCVKDEKTVKEN